MSGNSVNSVDGSVTAIATGYPSVEGQVRLSPDGSRRPGSRLVPLAGAKLTVRLKSVPTLTDHEMSSEYMMAIFTKSLWKSLSHFSHSADGTDALAWRGPRSRSSSAADATLRVRFAVAAATSAVERAPAADDSSVMDSGSGRSGRELTRF